MTTTGCAIPRGPPCGPDGPCAGACAAAVLSEPDICGPIDILNSLRRLSEGDFKMILGILLATMSGTPPGANFDAGSKVAPLDESPGLDLIRHAARVLYDSIVAFPRQDHLHSWLKGSADRTTIAAAMNLTLSAADVRLVGFFGDITHLWVRLGLILTYTPETFPAIAAALGPGRNKALVLMSAIVSPSPKDWLGLYTRTGLWKEGTGVNAISQRIDAVHAVKFHMSQAAKKILGGMRCGCDKRIPGCIHDTEWLSALQTLGRYPL